MVSPQTQSKQRFRGVRQRHWGSWVSEIRHPIMKTRIWLGTFETAKDAAMAYDEAARLMCGPCARTNFPYNSEPSSSSKQRQQKHLSATLTAKLHRCYQRASSQLTTTTTTTTYHDRRSSISPQQQNDQQQQQQTDEEVVISCSDAVGCVRELELNTSSSSSLEEFNTNVEEEEEEEEEEDHIVIEEMIEELLDNECSVHLCI